MEISSHYRQLLRELNEQRQHGILCDACVIVDGKIFKAHKNVLLGSSRYFKTLYCQVSDLACKDSSYDLALLLFLYNIQVVFKKNEQIYKNLQEKPAVNAISPHPAG